MFGDSYGELDSKKCPRQWTKNTPTEQAIRDNLLKNCLSRIKEKRKNVINNYRMNDTDSRRELVKNLIDEVYKASSPEAKGYQLNNNNSSSSYGVMDVFGSEDYYSLMDRIEDALSLELEAIDENDYYANQMEDYICSEESYSEVEENTLICPICR